MHLEQTNFSDQRYFELYRNGLLCAGAVIYSLKINLFTFTKSKFHVSMNVIGLPISNDQSGLLGDEENANLLVSEILKTETGILLCLNHLQELNKKELIHLESLPSMVFTIKHESWDSYLKSLRHVYRRRISKAQNKIQRVRSNSGTCGSFTNDHYEQYLAVLTRSKFKLEAMDQEFFCNLPESFKLRSFYDRDKLLFWNITIQDRGIHHFLFGGMDYSMRDLYDSYANNLIDIIQEGILSGCEQINLGQTAEVSKSRLGAAFLPKKMFLYHSNKYLRLAFKIFRKQLSYTKTFKENNVYKTYKTPKKSSTTNQLMECNHDEIIRQEI